MMNLTQSDTTSAEFFENLYRSADDPWAFAKSAYETARYDATLRALDGRRYGTACEPGCSVGVLTERLAGRCGSLLAMDISATAVERARARCGHLRNVEVRCAPLTAETVPEGLDLLVLSEIGYYFGREAWAGLAGTLAAKLVDGGTLLAVHWLGRSEDHLQTGDEVHAALGQVAAIRLEIAERREEAGPEAGFRLERFVRV